MSRIMRLYAAPFLGLAVIASVTNAHAIVSNIFVNNVNQGEGVCLRESVDINPKEVGTKQLTCGNDSPNTPSLFTCPVPAMATLTFEFRRYPDRSETSRDGDWFFKDDHWGPCAVYMKSMSKTMDDDVSGGWFKIMDDPTFDGEEWCTHRVKKAGGLLSVQLPSGLPAGPYLVRPELLALHQSAQGIPQFFTACAQIYVRSSVEGKLSIPSSHLVSIPSPEFCSKGDPRCTVEKRFDPPTNYKAPGPQAVRLLADSAKPVSDMAFEGQTPADCAFIKDEWCYPNPNFRTSAQCKEAVDSCRKGDLQDCLKSGRSTGGDAGDKFCERDFLSYCDKLEASCVGALPAQNLVPFTRDPPGPVPGWSYDGFDSMDIRVKGDTATKPAPTKDAPTKDAPTQIVATISTHRGTPSVGVVCDRPVTSLITVYQVAEPTSGSQTTKFV